MIVLGIREAVDEDARLAGVEGLSDAIVQLVINDGAPMLRFLVGHRMDGHATGGAGSRLAGHSGTSGRPTRRVHRLAFIVGRLVARGWCATGQLVASAGVGRRARVRLLRMRHVLAVRTGRGAGVRTGGRGIRTRSVRLGLIGPASGLACGRNLEQRKCDLLVFVQLSYHSVSSKVG